MTDSQKIYELLISMKPSSIRSERQWTLLAGVSPSFFNGLKNGHAPGVATLNKVLAAAEIEPSHFHALREPVRTEVAGARLVGGDVRRAMHGDKSLPALPLVGTAIGGDHGDIDDDIELTELHLSDVLDWLTRPASLAGDPDAYALTILSDSMAPKFEPNERVAVSPRAPVSIGDYVIAQLRGAEGEDERVKTVLIKRLKRRGAGFVELEQFNPPKIFRIEARRVASLHKVKGAMF